jgi:aminoglycoside 6-adenylyltransferase
MISRSKHEMMQLIMDVAANNQDIRAVLLNGSQANPNVAKDIFQDYDIIYVVKSLTLFILDHTWIDVFGERMILQMPEDMGLYPPTPELDGAFSYLMQFMDGNRIDLILVPIENLHHFLDDSLSKVLLDKDDMLSLASLDPASDKSYLVNRPSVREFGDCCNEFWYTNTGLAKGIWREQIPHAQYLFYNVIQSALIQMIDWHIGFRYQFSVNPGKYGKFYKEYLEPELYAELLETYPTGDVNEVWNAVFSTIKLFQRVAQNVAKQLGVSYPLNEHEHIIEYLQHVKQLPKNAQRIY